MVRKVIIVIGGFTEGQYEKTGSSKLRTELWKKFNRMTGHDYVTIVLPLKHWKHDWEGLADYLNRNGFEDAFVCAYSWGAGFGLKEFSKTFWGEVSCVLCDPVYRSKYPWMRWLALRNKQNTITYPSNVEVERVFYQNIDEPGNELVANFKGKRTRLNVPHTQIDEHPSYHGAAIKEIETWLQTKQQ